MNKQIIILIILTILSFIFWNTIVVYPVKLFVVLLHELSHGLAAILTGGKIIKVEISYLIGGSCTTQGGSPFLIANAGYLGSILLGGLLFVQSTKSKNIKFIGLFLSLSIFLITFLYIRNSFGIIFGISFSFILFLLTFILPKKILEWILKFIGLVSCFYVLIDIKEDLFSNPPKGTDANLLYQITGINAIFWAVLWGILALIAIIFFLRKSISK